LPRAHHARTARPPQPARGAAQLAIVPRPRIARWLLFLVLLTLAPCLYYEFVAFEIKPIGIIFLRAVLARSGRIDPFAIALAIQTVMWTVAWWALAAWPGRSARASVVAAVLALLVATAPIYGEAGHGPGRWGSALDAYVQELRAER
jgi:hypothetical protein